MPPDRDPKTVQDVAWNSGLPTKSEEEKRRRIRLAVYAYAYEILQPPISLVSDHVFDAECYKINLEIDTDRPDLDEWWRNNFHPHTGSWIWRYPEKHKLHRLVEIYQTFPIKE